MLIMKNLLLILPFIFASAVVAQNNNDADLLVKYSKEEITTLKKENIKEYNYLKACTKNAFYVTTAPKKKVQSMGAKVGKVSIPDVRNINFHALNIVVKEKNYQYFVINDSDKLLVVKSKEDILNPKKK